MKHSKSKGAARLLMLVIANHAHSDGTNAFPTIGTLASECNMSSRQIIRIVADLEKSGELIIERSQGRHNHNYALNMNTDKMSVLETGNPDKSDTATLTNPDINPDKSDNPTLTFSPSSYKDNVLNRTLMNEEEEKNAMAPEPEPFIDAANFEFPIKELIEAFPNVAFMPGQLDQIAKAVAESDRTAWLATVQIYKRNYDPMKNRYLPDKIGNLLGVFESQKVKVERQNGSNQQSNGRKPTPGEIIANREYR